MICWLIGHRYEYELSHKGAISLICTRCGKWKHLIKLANPSAEAYETRYEVVSDAD